MVKVNMKLIFRKLMTLVNNYKVPYPFVGFCLKDLLINASKIKVTLGLIGLRLCLV